MITGVYRGARIHPATLGAAGSLYIVGFIWVVVGVSLVFAFSWQAAGYAYPGTLGTIIAAAMLIVNEKALGNPPCESSSTRIVTVIGWPMTDHSRRSGRAGALRCRS